MSDEQIKPQAPPTMPDHTDMPALKAYLKKMHGNIKMFILEDEDGGIPYIFRLVTAGEVVDAQIEQATMQRSLSEITDPEELKEAQKEWNKNNFKIIMQKALLYPMINAANVPFHIATAFDEYTQELVNEVKISTF